MLFKNSIPYLMVFCKAFQLCSAAAAHLQTRDTATIALNPSKPGTINTYELGDPTDPAWIAMLTNVTNRLPVYFPGGQEGPYHVDGNSNVTIATYDRYTRLSRLNALFPGIFWDKAYPDSSPDSCTFAQLNVLEFATRVAVRLSYYNPSVHEDEAFQRYFVTDGRVSGRWSSGVNRPDYLNLLSNLVQAATFPSGGNKGRMGQKFRVAYQCGRVEHDPNNCMKKGVAAYTVGPDLSEYGWVIVFCPLFFEQRFTDMVTYNNKQPITVLDNTDFYTAEHVIMHEWMHNDKMGFPKHITDVKEGEGTMYGSNLCHELAWLNVGRGTEERPNPAVVYNADNYAWTWTSREFARAWGWASSDWTSIESVDTGTITFNTTDPDPGRNLTGPMESPINCADNGTAINCDSIGMPYDDYLLDHGAACNCTGNLCTSNSPSCCTTSSCASCAEIAANVNLTDLEAVPSCCLTNSCLWQSKQISLPVPTSTIRLPPSTSLATSTTSVVSSTTSTLPPPSRTGSCNCDENGCTANSPVCCANGTC